MICCDYFLIKVISIVNSSESNVTSITNNGHING